MRPGPKPGRRASRSTSRVTGSTTTRSTTRARLTLRYAGRLYHLGVGRPYKRTHVVLLVAGREVRILDERHC